MTTSITLQGKYDDIIINCEHHSQYEIILLTNIQQLIEDMYRKYTQIALLKFDLNFPPNYGYQIGNSLIEHLIKNYSNGIKDLNPVHIWVREESGKNNCSYKTCFLFNGKKLEDSRKIAKTSTIDERWAKTLSIPIETKGLIKHYPLLGLFYINMHKPVNSIISFLFNNMLNLAEASPKENIPYYAKKYGSSLEEE